MNFNEKIINIKDYLKRRFKIHTLESASIYPDDSSELSMEQLDEVMGGMGKDSFNAWRIKIINKKMTNVL